MNESRRGVITRDSTKILERRFVTKSSAANGETVSAAPTSPTDNAMSVVHTIVMNLDSDLFMREYTQQLDPFHPLRYNYFS